MKIIRGRLHCAKPKEFISVRGRIKSMIEKNKDDTFDFTIDIDGKKSIKTFGPDNIDTTLAGEKIPIVGGEKTKIEKQYVAVFNKDGTIDIIEETNESLPRQTNVDQLKRVMKQSAKTDIGNRIPDMNKQGANLQYIRNPINSGIESYEDYEKHNKKFIPSWNLRHLLSPFQHDQENKNKKNLI